MKSCLIIDDSIDMCNLLKTHLEKIPEISHITIENDGNKAIEIVQNREFDIIIVDEYIDKVSGLQVIKAIRSSDINNINNVVYFSSSIDRQHIKEANVYGVIHFFQKPFTFENLKTLILKVLS